MGLTWDIHHIVMYSGGIGSWAVAKRVVEQYGSDKVTLLFSDVRGSSTNEHAGEDPDTYRFIEETTKKLGAKLVTLSDGRNIWEVFKDEKMLGNSRLALCSRILKQEPAKKYLKENFDPETTFIYLGIDWTESHRLEGAKLRYSPYNVSAPLINPPYLTKKDMLKMCEDEGIKPPALYERGYAHNNCGGGCVRAGQGSFKHLLEDNPERFKFWEEKEKEMQELLGNPDVTILRKQENKKRTALSLEDLRKTIQSKNKIDEDDIGGCGCFLD